MRESWVRIPPVLQSLELAVFPLALSPALLIKAVSASWWGQEDNTPEQVDPHAVMSKREASQVREFGS
jgi:hypothetical protein